MEQSKRINKLLIFRIIILFLYSAFFMWLILSGAIMKYVHPRYHIFIIICCIFSGFIIIAMLSSIKTRSHDHGKIPALHAVFFVLPLLTAFFTKNMDVNYSESFSSAEKASKNNNINREDDTETYMPDFVKEARGKETIELTEKYFIPILQDIYSNPDKYIGKSVILTGKALKRKLAPDKEEFAIARMMMVCCAADMQPAGFICRYKDAPLLKANSWYRISGKFELVKIEDSEIPVIIVDEAVNTEKPEIEFVYPF